MTKIPEPENTIENLIDKTHEARAQKPRPHMGASMLGHPCERWMWLSFRWAVQPAFSGRVLRLFRRGHQEEENIIDDLRSIGVMVQNLETQTNVNFGSHVSGSIDAVINGGVPEAMQKRHIGEFKTHSLKSFNDVEAKGVEKSKPEHYAQMQIYMHFAGIERAFYLAVNKNTDELYQERIRYDAECALRLVAKAARIIASVEPPARISTDPGHFECKFCDHHAVCHGGAVPACFEALEALPGVGHKTASVVMAQAFGVPAFPVDTHIHRLAQRWGLSDGASVARTETDLKRLFPRQSWNKLHLQIIFYGREHCSARGCDGTVCPLCRELFPNRRRPVLTSKA
jgi:hypothetical protein